ncbi:MAG TPA: hypothetical protein VFC76_05425 [Oscillospiraceae bacterium]|nr:hypothetical protein [Oscillospiraceae bacterium]
MKNNKNRKNPNEKEITDKAEENDTPDTLPSKGEFGRQKESFEKDDSPELTTAEIIDFSHGTDS